MIEEKKLKLIDLPPGEIDHFFDLAYEIGIDLNVNMLIEDILELIREVK